ncbi:MAG TPA: DUF1554 domain-containing protein, partial [Leptospiraceae bacterium]|nr:DUF1554 domain-containing protein [Leptospiraceae bacterium]
PTSLASTKDILSFGIQTPNATGAISGTNITVTVAGNTNLKNLIANFTHNGSSVKIGAVTQTSGVTSNNFSYTMTYTVYAQDGSSQNYTVNVYATSCSAAAFCRIFAHAPASPAADFGSIPGAFGDGIVGIDTECNNGAIMIGLPPSNYRAILMTTGGTTIRNQTTNWVLKPNKQYRRQDGTTIIGTTNASSVFAVSGGNLTNSVVGAFSNIYTGILVNSDTSWTPSASNCSNWTSSAAVSVYGANGNFTNTLSFSDAGNSQTCNTGVGVYCVEQ